MKNVPQISVQEAALKVNPGDVLVVGGFGMTGTPIHLLDAIAETGVDTISVGAITQAAPAVDIGLDMAG